MLIGSRLADAIAKEIRKGGGDRLVKLFDLYEEVNERAGSCCVNMYCVHCPHFKAKPQYEWVCGLTERAQELGLEVTE